MCMTKIEFAEMQDGYDFDFYGPSADDIEWMVAEVYAADPWDGMDEWLEATYDPDL